MSFEPVNMRLFIEAQIVTFYPKSVHENIARLRLAIDKALKEEGVKHDFLVGATRITLEEKNAN